MTNNRSRHSLLNHLYSSKLKQLNRAIYRGNKLRCMVLELEAYAISQNLPAPAKTL